MIAKVIRELEVIYGNLCRMDAILWACHGVPILVKERMAKLLTGSIASIDVLLEGVSDDTEE